MRQLYVHHKKGREIFEQPASDLCGTLEPGEPPRTRPAYRLAGKAIVTPEKSSMRAAPAQRQTKAWSCM